MRKFFIFLGACGFLSIILLAVALIIGVPPNTKSIVKPIKITMI